jgi:hypothetical protein
VEATAQQTRQLGVAADMAVQAYETAFAATVPPPLIAANRAQLTSLLATNILGQNGPAIAATEAEYAQMWAQDAAAMYAYAFSSANVHNSLPTFTPAPQTTTNQVLSLASSAATPTTVGGGAQSIITDIQSLLGGSTISDILPVLDPLISDASPVDLLSLFTAFWVGTEAASILQNGGGNANVTVPNYNAGPQYYPLPSPVVTASTGSSSPIGGLSVPPSWTTQPWNLQSQVPTVTIAPGTQRFQAGIPVPPAVPVATAGRSARRRIREDPEYGHISGLTPARHPSAG